MEENSLYRTFKDNFDVDYTKVDMDMIKDWVYSTLNQICNLLPDEETFKPGSKLDEFVKQTARELSRTDSLASTHPTDNMNEGLERAYKNLGWLTIFAKDLAIVKDRCQDSFDNAVKNLKNQKDAKQFFDYAAELRSISMLFDKNNIEALLGDRPDIKIIHDNKELFVEVTQCALEFNHCSIGERPQEIFKKLRRTVNKKNTKSYSNRDTALFVFAKDIIENSEMVDGGINLNELFDRFSMNNEIKFGAIFILFNEAVHLPAEECYEYRVLYRRWVHEECGVELQNLINEFFEYDGTDIPT